MKYPPFMQEMMLIMNSQFSRPNIGNISLLLFIFLKLQAPPLSLTIIQKFDFLGAVMFAGAAISLVIEISSGGIMYT
jgi:hypothetical protein